MKVIAFYISLMLLMALSPAWSQEEGDCQASLNRANAEFEAGRFYGLPSILKTCLDNGFSNEQKVRAYLLLTQTYLILDDPIAAEDSYLKLLQADPEYVATPEKDPIDVVYLSKKFTATPRFTPHFRAGTNTAWTRIIREFNTDPYSEVTTDSYLRPGFQIGAGIDWNMTDNWSISTGLSFSGRSFRKVKQNISGDDELTIIEKQTWIDIPFYLKYQKSVGKIRPFGYVGYSLNLLVGYRVSLNGVDNSPSLGNTQSPVSGADERLLSKRNFFNQSIITGGGFKYKLGKDFLYVDLRYAAGLTNLVRADLNAYDPSDNTALDNDVTTYRWVSDLFRMDNLSLSVGYIRPIYDPRKIRTSRVSNFFDGLFKKKK